MIEGSDPISTGIFTLLEVGPKDRVVDHIQEGCNGMPALVVKPHLQDTTSASKAPGTSATQRLPKPFRTSLPLLRAYFFPYHFS